MTNEEFAKGFKELMEKWNTARAAWIAKFGNDDGFSEWFTKQLENLMKS